MKTTKERRKHRCGCITIKFDGVPRYIALCDLHREDAKQIQDLLEDET